MALDVDQRHRRHSEYSMTSSQAVTSSFVRDRKLSATSSAVTSATDVGTLRQRKISLPDFSDRSGYLRLQGLRVPSPLNSNTEALVNDLPLIKTASSVEDVNIVLKPTPPVVAKQRRLTPATITAPFPTRKSLADLDKIVETDHTTTDDDTDSVSPTPALLTTTARNKVNGRVDYERKTSSQHNREQSVHHTAAGTQLVFQSEAISLEKYLVPRSKSKASKKTANNKLVQNGVYYSDLVKVVQTGSTQSLSIHSSLSDSAFGSSDDLDRTPVSPRVTLQAVKVSASAAVAMTTEGRKLSESEDDLLLSPHYSSTDSVHRSSVNINLSPTAAATPDNMRQHNPATATPATSTSKLASKKQEHHEIEVVFIKNALGLGFCIEGGVGSVLGDKPISIKKLYGGACHAQEVLQVGDEIVRVNGRDYHNVTHFTAWNRLKALPDGPVRMTIRRL